MKAVLSILIGLLLAFGQFEARAGADSVAPAPCAGCSCAQVGCCAPGTPLPLSVPVNSQSNEQRVQTPALIVVAVLAAPAESLAQASFSLDDFLLTHAGVPIYDRNCSYLL